jgi:hypothetical protein
MYREGNQAKPASHVVPPFAEQREGGLEVLWIEPKNGRGVSVDMGVFTFESDACSLASQHLCALREVVHDGQGLHHCRAVAEKSIVLTAEAQTCKTGNTAARFMSFSRRQRKRSDHHSRVTCSSNVIVIVIVTNGNGNCS